MDICYCHICTQLNLRLNLGQKSLQVISVDVGGLLTDGTLGSLQGPAQLAAPALELLQQPGQDRVLLQADNQQHVKNKSNQAA